MSVGVDQIQQRKWDVAGMAGQRFRSDPAGIFSRPRLRRTRAQLAQDSDPAFTDNFASDFVHGGQHAADPTRSGIVGHRAIRDGEVRLLEEAAAINLEENVVHPGRRPAKKRRVDERLQNVPDLTPALTCRLSQGLRVLAAGDWTIGIVVDLYILWPPPQQQWKTIGQQKAHRRA